MINFFHKFISNFMKQAAHVNALCKKFDMFCWCHDEQCAFQDMKFSVMTPPILLMVDSFHCFVLQTDASSMSLGAILLQDFDYNHRPIVYASRTPCLIRRGHFCPMNLSVLHFFGLEKFRPYLEHVEFYLQTDSQCVMWHLSHHCQLCWMSYWVFLFCMTMLACISGQMTPLGLLLIG
jgi:hypothetical protein